MLNTLSLIANIQPKISFVKSFWQKSSIIFYKYLYLNHFYSVLFSILLNKTPFDSNKETIYYNQKSEN